MLQHVTQFPLQEVLSIAVGCWQLELLSENCPQRTVRSHSEAEEVCILADKGSIYFYVTSSLV